MLRHRVVVVGGGFGGLEAVRGLRREPVGITLLDRRNFYLFQPLVYQVATGMLSPGEITSPLRALFKHDRNVRVLLAEAVGFDLDRRHVLVDGIPGRDGRRAIQYDSLIVSAGSRYSYFGHDEWRPYAPDVKSLESVLDVRRRILTAFEAAEVEPDPVLRAAWLTFVVVGAGPTGVELAGQIAELARRTVRDEFRTIDTGTARILLVEAADRVLPGFPPRLSACAARALEHLGVEPLVRRKVVGIDPRSVTIETAGGAAERVPSMSVVWAAGIVASGLATELATASGAELDRGGRVAVGPDLTLPGHPEVLAIGDMVRVHDADGEPLALPGLAPVAMQEGRHAARVVRDRLRRAQTAPFRYRDRGDLATVGRAKAVGEIKGVQLSGLPAWLTWLLVHLFYLIGLQNRLVVLIRWTFSFARGSSAARLITGLPFASARATFASAGATEAPSQQPSATAAEASRPR